MPNIKENTVSLFLLSIADKINKDLPVTSINFTKLTSTNTSNIDVQTSFEIMRRESELFSFNPMPSSEIAEELFKDLNEQETRSEDYVIHHDIVFKEGGAYYKFNIEQENANNTIAFADNNDPVTGFYIQSIQIKNAPKDIFTTRANYTVTVKILFNFFDDLLKDSVEVVPAGVDFSDPTSSMIASGLFYRPIIKLLYKNYFEKNSNLINNIQDTTGIYLVQRLQFKQDTDKFTELNQFLSNNQIGKTYHLISKQHEFNICKSNEAASVPFDNELTITYVASEVEGMPNNGERLAEQDRKNLFELLNYVNIPSTASSIFNNNENTIIAKLSTYLEKITALRDEQARISKDINCLKLSDTLKSSNPTQAASASSGVTRSIDQLRTDFEYNKNQLDGLILEMNRALMLQILLECNIFEIQNIDISLLNTFEQNFKFWEYMSNQGWAGVGTVLGTAAVIGGIAAATAATGGAAAAALSTAGPTLLLGGVGGASSLISEIAKEPLVSADLDVNSIRNAINSLSIQPVNAGAGITQQQRIKNIFPNIKSGAVTKNQPDPQGTSKYTAGSALVVKGSELLSENRQKDIESEISNSLAIKAPEADDQAGVSGTTNIRFIRFQDIINVYKKLNPDVKIITGGKMIVDSASSGNVTFLYLNNADAVISLEAFTSFLYKNIVLKDRKLFYDSEEFLRDAFQALIGKDLLAANDSISDEIKKLAPTNLRFNTSINVKTSQLDSSLPNSTLDVLDDARFNQTKKQIFLTRNISGKNFNSGASLVKLLFLGSDQDVKYYDFYSKYQEWASINIAPSQPRGFSSVSFQKFINTQYLMPCVPIRNSSIVETILKSKNVTFSRIDNKNLETGVILSDNTRRLPYQIKTKLQPYLTFFMGSSNYMFVAPPETGDGSVNLFGFGGLYIIKQTNFEWNFVSANSANPIFVSSYDIDGYHVSYGDGVKLTPSPSAIPPTGAKCNGIPLTASRIS
jgi:hypothetical protein